MSGIKAQLPRLAESVGVVKKLPEYAAQHTIQPAAKESYKSVSGGRASFASRRRRALMSDSAGAVKLDAEGMAKSMHKDMMKTMLGE